MTRVQMQHTHQLLQPLQLGFKYYDRKQMDSVLDPAPTYSIRQAALHSRLRADKKDGLLCRSTLVFEVIETLPLAPENPARLRCSLLACLYLRDKSQARDLRWEWIGLPADA